MKITAVAVTLSLTVLMMVAASPGYAADQPPLALEAKIPLGAIRGRIDHLAVDLGRHRLFVAELGNDSVGVIDVEQRRVLRTIAGLKEPQGVGYAPVTDTLYVANGDGSVRLFAGAELSPAGRIDLGEDADNVRVDVRTNQVFVGYGSALAIIDPATRAKIGDMPLPAHPEGFQLDETGTKIFVNLPDAKQIALIDPTSRTVSAAIPLTVARANFPMAIDPGGETFFAVSRNPPKLLTFGARDHALRSSVDTCGDADDIFVDAKRHRLYVSCGAGFVDVFDWRQGEPVTIGHVATAAGARTSLFVPEIDRLFVAVRAEGGEAAEIWVFRPQPS